jgi:hypothetical protein
VKSGDVGFGEMAHELGHESRSIECGERTRMLRQDLGRRREEMRAAPAMPRKKGFGRHQPSHALVLFARRRHQVPVITHDRQHRLGAPDAADLAFDAQLGQPARSQPGIGVVRTAGEMQVQGEDADDVTDTVRHGQVDDAFALVEGDEAGGDDAAGFGKVWMPDDRGGYRFEREIAVEQCWRPQVRWSYARARIRETARR